MRNKDKTKEKYTIYRIACLANGRIYIGATRKSVVDELGEHFRYAKSKEPKFFNDLYLDMKFLGENAFTIAALEKDLDESEARESKAYWVRYYRSSGYITYNKVIYSSIEPTIELTDRNERLVYESLRSYFS